VLLAVLSNYYFFIVLFDVMFYKFYFIFAILSYLNYFNFCFTDRAICCTITVSFVLPRLLFCRTKTVLVYYLLFCRTIVVSVIVLFAVLSY